MVQFYDEKYKIQHVGFFQSLFIYTGLGLSLLKVVLFHLHHQINLLSPFVAHSM
jgi:hypothetical protein